MQPIKDVVEAFKHLTPSEVERGVLAGASDLKANPQREALANLLTAVAAVFWIVAICSLLAAPSLVIWLWGQAT